MDGIPLSDLRIGNKKQCIRVRASRVWNRRRGLHDEVTHICMVLIDEKGDAIYAIVRNNLVAQYRSRLHETATYDLMLFNVSTPCAEIIPVDNPLVIVFTELTVIQPILDPAVMFPEWTYKLASFTELRSPNADPRKFVDVIGVIRGISNISTLRMPGNNTPVTRRHVVLADESASEMRITLWGEAALRFNERVLRFVARDESSVVIFVARTVHMYDGIQELAGADACRWYINQDIEDINIFRASIQFQTIEQLPVPRHMNLQPSSSVDHPLKTLSFLLNINLFQNQNSKFQCAVKIWRFTPGRQWWIALCAQCGRLTSVTEPISTQPAKYKCSDDACDCTDASPEYSLHLLGSDDTGEAEFNLFGKVAEDIIGVSARRTILNNSPGDVPITNLALAASSITHTPPEIASIVSCKYKFVVYVTANSFFRKWASFNVMSVEAYYPPE